MQFFSADKIILSRIVSSMGLICRITYYTDVYLPVYLLLLLPVNIWTTVYSSIFNFVQGRI